MKIISYGFILNGKNSYLLYPSNVLDIFIVITALFNMYTDKGSTLGKLFGKFKIFRVIKTIRPLRVVSRSEKLSIAINSIITSFP